MSEEEREGSPHSEAQTELKQLLAPGGLIYCTQSKEEIDIHVYFVTWPISHTLYWASMFSLIC